MSIKSPLKRIGGKAASAREHIVPFFPSPDTYKTYCEPCFGAGHVFFAKPRYNHDEIICDLENNLMTFWMQMLDHADEMQSRLEMLPYARSLYYQYYRSLFDGSIMPDMERAIRYFYVLRATGTGWMRRSPVGWNGRVPAVKAYESAIETFHDVQERMKGVVIDNRDILVTIKRYDSPTTLFFIDPPYIGAEWYYEACRENAFPHEELASLLNNIKGKVALSYYPHPDLDAWYPESTWHRLTWTQPKSSDIKSENMSNATEMLLTNYQQQATLFDEVSA